MSHCDPHSSWQCGFNANANGLLREYLPDGADLRNITQARLNRVEDLLNKRPCKTLG